MRAVQALYSVLSDQDGDRLSSYIESINVMGARPLIEHAEEWISKHDDTGDWVRRLEKQKEIDGPFLAIARQAQSTLTLLDGHHRAAAWISDL